MSKDNSRVAVLTGLALAGTGVAHFVKPELFESLTKSAFPIDTAKHIKIDGGVETALGLGVVVQKTRKLAVVGLLGYGAYLAANVARNQ